MSSYKNNGEAYIKGCIIDPKTFQHISKQRLYIFGDVYTTYIKTTLVYFW